MLTAEVLEEIRISEEQLKNFVHAKIKVLERWWRRRRRSKWKAEKEKNERTSKGTRRKMKFSKRKMYTYFAHLLLLSFLPFTPRVPFKEEKTFTSCSKIGRWEFTMTELLAREISANRDLSTIHKGSIFSIGAR